MSKNDGGPAFPAPAEPKTDWTLQDVTSGMSLRDWFAGQAIGSPELLEMRRTVREHDLAKWFGGRNNITEAQIFAVLAFQFADAMLAERNKE